MRWRDEVSKQVNGCSLGPSDSCDYADIMVSMFSTTLEDGTIVHQLKTQTYSKPTDVHKYIHPSSCTPNLSSKSPAIIKGVAHRLRLTNTNDEDLLAALNQYSGIRL